MAKKSAAASVDPVTQYARDVVAGTIVAGRLVRLQCQRHLDDLAAAAEKGLVWKPDQAQRVIDFFPAILRLPENVTADDEVVDDDLDLLSLEGQPFVLSPHQQFIAGSLFGWYSVRGFRRYRIAYFEGGKGCGKTPFGAGLMIYLAVADGERGAQVFFAAPTLGQAKLPFTDAERMVEASPSLRKIFDPTVNNLAVKTTGSFIRAVSAEKKGLDGKRVHGCLLEELHEQTRIVVQKMRAGIKGRRNALILGITNSGFDRQSVCWDWHEYSRQVLEGTIVNETWFAYVCQLDVCEDCRAAGKLQPSDTCGKCDDWRVEGPHWLKANPNLGVSLPWDYLRDTVREAVDMPSQQSIVKRLNFCIWTEQVTVWIPVDRWGLCQSPAVTAAALAGRECFIGCDLSEKIDLASVQVVFPRPLQRDVAVLDSEQAITRALDVLSFFWMPEETLQQRSREDNIPYPEWRDHKYLTSTPGALIDHDAIADFIITVLSQLFRIRGIGIDQAGATAFVTRLQRHFGDELVTEVPQGFRMLSGPSKTFEALVFSRNLAHDGNPVMTMCVGNMGKEENHWREIRPVKISQRKRIDGGVALIDAICTMERTEPEADSVYQRRGVVSL